MDNRIQQILNSAKSKQGTNTDTYTNVNFEASQRLLPLDDINYTLDVAEQFNTERQSSSFYRIMGKINPLISNVLFNTTGSKDCWQMFNTQAFTLNDLNDNKQYSTFAQSIQKNLKEIDGWYGYFNNSLKYKSVCNFIDMEPKRQRFSFIGDTTNLTNTQPTKNWELTITYPYAMDKTHPMVSNGLLLVDSNTCFVGGKYMSALSVPVYHNLVVGDSIILTGTNMDGQYTIKRVGLDDGSHKNTYFCIDADPTQLLLGHDSRMVKIYNGVPSQYYFRKFKKIKTRVADQIRTQDYETFKLAFSENVYTDDIIQFVFNEDIDVSNLVDNLGRPLSQLYLTIIKTDSNQIFTNVSSGIEVPFIPEFNNANYLQHLKRIPAIQKIHNVTTAPSQTFNALELDVKIGNDDFYGDVVEYNTTTIEEVILSDVYHRFNTFNRENSKNAAVGGPRPEGYYYKAHYLMQIRNFSNYIESGDAHTADMPDYKTQLSDGTFIYRDLMDIGTTNLKTGTLNYPFLNGCHYLYQNYCFDVRRQDPFDNWNLYYSGFPADPIGDATPNNFKVNQVNDVC